MNVVSLAVSHAVAFVAGAYVWPHLSTLWTSFTASRAVAAAQALIAKAEADAKALEAAKATVAAAAPVAPVPTATGATGTH